MRVGDQAFLVCPANQAYGSAGFNSKKIQIPADATLTFLVEIKQKVAFSVKVTSEGSGAIVQKGDKIKAHYRGTLPDGTQFDASYDRGTPLDFTVGASQVIKCWDQGFVGLKIGAKADFVCPPDYAYGNRARGQYIKENATLLFSVEVVDILTTQKHEKIEPKKA